MYDDIYKLHFHSQHNIEFSIYKTKKNKIIKIIKTKHPLI